MGKDRAAQTPGTGRRGVLKNIMTLGAAAPLAALLSGTACEAAPVGTGQPQVKLTPLQLAGQRVIYSYPGRPCRRRCCARSVLVRPLG